LLLFNIKLSLAVSPISEMRLVQNLIATLLLCTVNAVPAVHELHGTVDGSIEKRQAPLRRGELSECLMRRFNTLTGDGLWPHENCGGKHWDFDSRSWKSPHECWDACKAEILGHLDMRHEKAKCTKNAGLARCEVKYE